MFINCLAEQTTTQHLKLDTIKSLQNIPNIADLTEQELDEIAQYTVQKINNYPKSFGKTVENYFDLLYCDEVKNYLIMQAINEKSYGKIKSVLCG